MPIAKNTNLKFMALPRTVKNVVAETPCAICDQTANVKVRSDGWIEIRCSQSDGCGYSEEMTGDRSFNEVAALIGNNEKTEFRRTTRAEFMAALDIEPEQPEEDICPANSDPDLANAEPESEAPKPTLAPIAKPVEKSEPVAPVKRADDVGSELFGETDV